MACRGISRTNTPLCTTELAAEHGLRRYSLSLGTPSSGLYFFGSRRPIPTATPLQSTWISRRLQLFRRDSALGATGKSPAASARRPGSIRAEAGVLQPPRSGRRDTRRDDPRKRLSMAVITTGRRQSLRPGAVAQALAVWRIRVSARSASASSMPPTSAMSCSFGVAGGRSSFALRTSGSAPIARRVSSVV